MAFRHPTLRRRSRRFAAGLALAIGLNAAGAQAMPFPDFAPQSSVVPVHDHDGYGDRGYGHGHHYRRGPDRGWDGGHRGWDYDRGHGRRGWGHHHHHHGRDRGYYPY
ncbi:hypothetical protein [Methylobacterium sp. J-090]|uniref:hypothetical protein n=1 Tax=Methylobacterium sp. J-090 TaxID=2836666 RepID=UPI001FBB25A0|nr:hypothetical protein [Methylobacterium sp. J-090]MCJ2083112.1 hypothetical protein [Methylobacterium sp. J-090]